MEGESKPRLEVKAGRLLGLPRIGKDCKGNGREVKKQEGQMLSLDLRCPEEDPFPPSEGRSRLYRP